MSAITAGGAAGMMEALVCHPLGKLPPSSKIPLHIPLKPILKLGD
jgi:hypothetical protein